MAKWTRERIIREILARESAGETLTASYRQGVGSRLYQAGTRMFGSWRNALLAAGISPARAKLTERWPPEKVLATIIALSRKERPLGPTESQRRHGYLVRAAQRHFGSWAKAVAAAGVDPGKLRRVPQWTRDGIIKAILERALDNAPLGSRSVRPRSLADFGARLFGSWRAALLAAGVNPTLVVTDAAPLSAGVSGRIDHEPASQARRWTPEGVIDAILARLREQMPINAVAVRRDNPSLHSGGRRRFGNWRKALIAAGLHSDEILKTAGSRANP